MAYEYSSSSCSGTPADTIVIAEFVDGTEVVDADRPYEFCVDHHGDNAFTDVHGTWAWASSGAGAATCDAPGHILADYYNVGEIGVDSFPPPIALDADGNPIGSQYDLGMDGAFTEFSVLFCSLRWGAGMAVTPWLLPKGFSVTESYTFDDCAAKIPSFSG